MNRLFKYSFAAMALVVSAAGTALATDPPPPAAVPEPGTLILLGVGAAGLVLYKTLKK